MFRIAPHFRLQEWVAEEKGYFKSEKLDYEFRDGWGKDDPGKMGSGRYDESTISLSA